MSMIECAITSPVFKIFLCPHTSGFQEARAGKIWRRICSTFWEREANNQALMTPLSPLPPHYLTCVIRLLFWRTPLIFPFPLILCQHTCQVPARMRRYQYERVNQKPEDCEEQQEPLLTPCLTPLTPLPTFISPMSSGCSFEGHSPFILAVSNTSYIKTCYIYVYMCTYICFSFYIAFKNHYISFDTENI